MSFFLTLLLRDVRNGDGDRGITYRLDILNTTIVFIRLGAHSQLFKKFK